MRLISPGLSGRAFACLGKPLERLALRSVSQPVGMFAVALCALVLASLPFAETDVAEVAKVVLPGMMVTGAVAQMSTFAFLAVLYRRTSRFSAAVLAAAFSASGTVALGLPALVPLGPGRDALVVLGAQSSAWLWIAWHALFPAGALAYALVRAREKRGAPIPAGARVMRFAALAGFAAGLLVIAAVVCAVPFLPPLVHGLDLTGYRKTGVSSAILTLCVCALVALLRVPSQSARDGALLLAVLAVTLEMATNLVASHRFTVLWYVGRSLYLGASVFVLVSTVRDMLRWSGRAVALRDTLDRETRRAERHAARLRALWQTNSATTDDDAFLRAVVDDASQMLSDGRAFFGLIVHLAGAEMVVDVASKSFVGPWVAVAGERYPLSESVLGVMLTEGATRSWSDIRTDERFARSERLRSVPWRAMIGTRFRVAQTVYYIGFALPVPLCADESFTALDHAYVETLASICAARLHQRAQFERLRYQTEHDLLTGIYNRATFRAHGFAAVRSGKPVALAVVAIDAFRSVNDTLGHQTGDALLVEVAARLCAHAGPDDVVARLGGDTFGVLMGGIATRADAEVGVRRYVSAFREAFGTGDREGKERVTLSASVGIALAPDDAEGFEELLARADAAVYDAKQAGRARWAFFDRRVEADFQTLRRLKDELAHALANDELVLHFQPHVELSTGRARGAEALVRWEHPERGLLPPSEFVPFAERHGFAEQLGSWVMRETIRITEPWRRADPSLRFWCNVSQTELRCPALSERLAQLEPRLCGIGVEITEGAVMDNADEMAKAIAMLREAGFSIALDDFGTGYSSLAHLRRLPIDVVKIDRSFIAGIPHDQHDVAIVEAVTSIAQRYGFEIVAEGVETMEQVAFLAAGGCTYGQGYLYARPMPAGAFERWMRERREAVARLGVA